MIDVIVEPYSSLKQKIAIRKRHPNMKFMDLDGCLMNIENTGRDEATAWQKVREWRGR